MGRWNWPSHGSPTTTLFLEFRDVGRACGRSRLFRRRCPFREQSSEAIEAPLHQHPTCSDPVGERRKTALLQPAHAHAADLLAAYETAGLQHLQVLHDGGERHGERFGEIADAGWTVRQPLNERAARRFGKGAKAVIDGRMLKHGL